MQTFYILLIVFICSTFGGVSIHAEPTDVSSTQEPQTDFSKDLSKLVDESRQEVNKIENEIKKQADLKRNQLREDYAKECYQKGLALTEQGRFAEARTYFDKAIHVTQRTEMAEDIKAGEDRLKIQEEALRAAKKEFDAEEIQKQKAAEQKRIQAEAQQRREEQAAKIAQEQQAKAEAAQKIKEEKLKQQQLAAEKAANEKKQREEELRLQREAKIAAAKEAEEKRKEELRQKDEELRQQREAQIAAAKEAEEKRKEELRKQEEQRKADDEEKARQQAAIRQQQEEAQKQKELEHQRELEAAKAEAANLKRIAEQKNLEAASKIQALNQQTETLYQNALTLFRQNKLAEAKGAFNQVEAVSANYQSTRSYLKTIDQRLSDEEAAKAKQIKEEEKRKEREAAIAKAKEELNARLEVLHKEEQAKEAIRKQAEADYNAALDLFRDKIYLDSKQRFQKVSSDLPHYKATDSYLRKIDQIMARQAQQQELERKRAEEKQRKEEELAQKRLQKEQQLAEEIKAKAEKASKSALEQPAKQVDAAAKQAAEKDALEAKNKALQEREQQELEAKRQRAEAKAKEELAQQKAKEEARAKFLAQQKADEEKRMQAKLAEDAKASEEVAKKIVVPPVAVPPVEVNEEQERAITAENYVTAVEFYKEKKYKEARDKFIAVNEKKPGYKATNTYLKRLERLISAQDTRENKEKQKALELQRKQEEEAKRLEAKHQEWLKTHPAAKESLVQPIAAPVVSEPAKIEAPKTETAKVEPPKVDTPKTETAPIQSVATPPTSKEASADETELLARLAEKSSRLYKEISMLADDRQTAVAMNKLAKVDGILNNLKEEKERNIRQIREEEEKRHQMELKAKQDLRLKEASNLYDEAILLVSSRDFDKAKRKFLEVENIQPNFKSTRNYLKHIDEDQRKMQEDALAEKTRNEERMRKEAEAKKREQEELQRKDRVTKLQQRQSEIAQRAASINDEILKYTVAKNYTAAKTKFDELEQTMTELKQVKDLLGTEKDQAELVRAQAREAELSKRRLESVLDEKRLENIQSKNDSVYKKRQLQDTMETEKFKLRESKRQRDVIYKQGVDLFKAKKYQESRIIFSELISKGDERAKSYLKKIDQLSGKEIDAIKEKSSRQMHSEYLAERLNQQRVKRILDNNEQERQRKLSKDLEDQKSFLEDREQEERRRVETLKIQAKQRQRIEEQKQLREAQNSSQDKEYHFRKVNPATLTEEPPPPQEVAAPVNLDTKVSINQVIKEKEETVKKEAEERRVRFLNREKAEDLERFEAAKKIELEKSINERKQKLANDQRMVRQQLESGVDSMYNEAVKLYRAGQYQAAATRFEDIQELMPNYKNADQYLKKTQERAVKTPVAPRIASKDDQVAKSLDIFDSNSK